MVLEIYGDDIDECKRMMIMIMRVMSHHHITTQLAKAMLKNSISAIVVMEAEGTARQTYKKTQPHTHTHTHTLILLNFASLRQGRRGGSGGHSDEDRRAQRDGREGGRGCQPGAT